MQLKQALQQAGATYAKIGREVSMSAAALSRLANYGEYPTKRKVDEVQSALARTLAGFGLSDIAFPNPGVRPGANGAHREAVCGAVQIHTAYPGHLSVQEIDLMQLDRSVLAHFGLKDNPFTNDIDTEDDVYTSEGYERVGQAIRDAVEQRGFLAVTGSSGAGKTTLWDGIESEYALQDDITICRPKIADKKKLSPDHIARCLLYGIHGDDFKISPFAEERGMQLTGALRSIRTGQQDRRVVLLLDDAHFCNGDTLRLLKSLFEIKLGRFKLLSIVLIGLPELKAKLGQFIEIGNRTRVVEMPPVPVEEYLNFKLRRMGSAPEKLFDAEGWQAFLDRFRAPKKAALGHPLHINVLAIRAMVKLHRSGPARGERISRQVIDSVPTASPAVRQVA